jgi:CBS domain-containing protein
MRVQDLMTKDVFRASPQTNAAAAAEIMWNTNCGALPIVEGGTLVGIVTDRDLFIALGTQNRRPSDLEVREVMCPNPVCCAPGDDIRQALKIMANEKIHRLPVVNESGSLSGILSLDDVVVYLDSAVRDDALLTLRAICEHQTNGRHNQPLVVHAST